MWNNYPTVHPNVIGSVVSFGTSQTEEWYETLANLIRHTKEVLSPLIPPGLKLSWCYSYDYKERRARTEAEFFSVLRSGKLRSFGLITNVGGFFGPWVIAGEVSAVRPGWPVCFQFSFDPQCCGLDAKVTAHWQHQAVNLLQHLVLNSPADYGFLTIEPYAVDPSLAPTPYEQWVRCPLDQPVQLERMARGYFWGNVLGPKHIQALGGLDHILASAPCSVSLFPATNGPWVYLQISPDINDFGDEALRELRSFLARILPTGERSLPMDRRFRLIYD